MTGLWLGSKAFHIFSRDLLIRAIDVMLIANGLSLITRGLA